MTVVAKASMPSNSSAIFFPDLIDLPTEIVYIHEGADNSIPDLECLQQFTRLKFDYMSFSKLNFNAAEYFSNWISEKKNVLLVSRLLWPFNAFLYRQRSFAKDIIHNHQLPVFIAHP